MVAINKILLPEYTGEGCGGETGTCTDSRVHRRNAENRAPATRNRCRGVTLGRWLTRDPIGYRGGINLYGYVDSSPVGNVDAEGLQRFTSTPVQPAPPPGSAEALLQQYSGRNSKNYPPNLPPPYDGVGGVPLGPLASGGWHFTGKTGRERVGYTDFKTLNIDGQCVTFAHPIYAPTAQIERGGNAPPEWVSDLVDGMVGIGAGFVAAAASSATGLGAIFVGGAVGGLAAAGVNGLMTGEPLQTRWIRVYGPTWVGQTWVEVDK